MVTPLKSGGLKYPMRENKELNFSLKKGNKKKIQIVHKNLTVIPLELSSWIIPKAHKNRHKQVRWVYAQRQREE